jgi:hypothetical protein
MIIANGDKLLGCKVDTQSFEIILLKLDANKCSVDKTHHKIVEYEMCLIE